MTDKELIAEARRVLDGNMATFKVLFGEVVDAFAARQWQPIETAPTDGTMMLLSGAGWVRIGRPAGPYWEIDGAGISWTSCDGWMPIPTPPETKL